MLGLMQGTRSGLALGWAHLKQHRSAPCHAAHAGPTTGLWRKFWPPMWTRVLAGVESFVVSCASERVESAKTGVELACIVSMIRLSVLGLN